MKSKNRRFLMCLSYKTEIEARIEQLCLAWEMKSTGTPRVLVGHETQWGHTTYHYHATSTSSALGIIICGQLTDVPVICGLEQRSGRGEDEGMNPHSLAFHVSHAAVAPRKLNRLHSTYTLQSSSLLRSTILSPQLKLSQSNHTNTHGLKSIMIPAEGKQEDKEHGNQMT